MDDLWWLWLVLVLVVLILACVIPCKRWNSKARALALTDPGPGERTVAQTSMGPVEYSWIGRKDAPVVLCAHGSPGGCDARFLDLFLEHHGFSIITPSRPGYLNTPLDDNNASYEQQADTFAALVDHLGLTKVCICGVSGGGPLALWFAHKHASKTACLLQIVAASQKMELSEEMKAEISWFTKPGLSDFFSWTTALAMNSVSGIMKQAIGEETTYSEEEVDEFVQHVVNDAKMTDLLRSSLMSTLPMSVRKVGFQNDIDNLDTGLFPPLAEIEVPTLIIYSSADKDVPEEHAHHMRDNIANSTTLDLHGGHLLFMGFETDKLEQESAAFLKQHLTQGRIEISARP